MYKYIGLWMFDSLAKLTRMTTACALCIMMFYGPTTIKDITVTAVSSLSDGRMYCMKHVESQDKNKRRKREERQERAKRVFIKSYSYYYTAAFSAHPLRIYTSVWY